MDETGSSRVLHPGYLDSTSLTCLVRERSSSGRAHSNQLTQRRSSSTELCLESLDCSHCAQQKGKITDFERGVSYHGNHTGYEESSMERWGWTGGGNPHRLGCHNSLPNSGRHCSAEPSKSTAIPQLCRVTILSQNLHSSYPKEIHSHNQCICCDSLHVQGHRNRVEENVKQLDRTTRTKRSNSKLTSKPRPSSYSHKRSRYQNQGWRPLELLTFFLTFLVLSPGQGQIGWIRMTSAQVTVDSCPETTDCHPPSENLINPVYAMRILDVSSTCGTPDGVSTTYRKASSTLDFDDYMCNATYPHPKANMYDYQNEQVLDFQYENPKLNTYWQSENTISALGAFPNTEWVVFNMTEPFLVRYIRVVFISPHIDSATDNSDNRPLAMVIERQETPTDQWTPWRYYAKNCIDTFPPVSWDPMDGTGPDFSATTPVCQQRYYAGSMPFTGWGFGRQEVQFNPSRDFDPEFQTSAEVQRHFMASAVRIRLVKPADTEPLSSYYAIGDLEIDGQCSCFGHASFCSGVNGATCGCKHNTEGENCEKCLPLFNNKPWQPGALRDANACEDCGCGGHATSCQYDADKGYGVCDNCTDNTTGDKCQYCVDYFYVNPANTSAIPPSDLCTAYNGTEYVTFFCNDYCIPCNCSMEGSDPAGSYMCQNASGQCLCKSNVQGRDCSECKDEYYNLTQHNPLGCQECVCDVRGTYNSTQLCDKMTGECICKMNTQGSTCSQCKPGYYGLSVDNPDGCMTCGCDPGASLNSSCPLVSGECPCRVNIHGRTCQQPAVGFYVPALDHLTYDAEFAPNATEHFTIVERPGHGLLGGKVTGRGFVRLPQSSTLRFKVQVPQTGNYHIIARYETAGVWSPAHLSMRVVDTGAGVLEYSCGGKTVSTSTLLQLEATVQPATVAGGADFGQLCLLGGVDYDFHFELGNSDPQGEEMLLDSIVLLPFLEDLPFFGTVSRDTRQVLQDCYIETVPVNLAQRANYSCAQHEYSIMSFLYNGAIACDCNPVGSNHSVCDPMGGQCACKPGVMLLDCSQCQVDHYGFSSGQGCTPCGCDPHGSIRTACNDTGMCECRKNVIGDQCDTCAEDHYGLYTGEGCIPCTCNLDHAYNNSCIDTGQCHCKPGVGGQNCDHCLDGFFNLTTDGCMPCGCDPDGSQSLTCDKKTGGCTCKTLAQGDKCDHCQPGYYALGNWSPLGCLACSCSGHSSECGSSSGWFLTNASNDWSLLMSISAIQEPWTGVDGEGNAILVEHPVKIIGNEGQFVMQVTNNENIAQVPDVFFLAAHSYLGNKQSAYKHSFSFSMSMYIPEDNNVDNNDTTPDMSHNALLPTADGGDVILEGAEADFKLVVSLPNPPTSNVTEYSFQLTPEVWHVNSVSGQIASYVQMIQILSDLSAIRIRAKYSNVSDAEVALYSAMLTYATNDSSLSTVPVNNVENCTCPKQYTGPQCETCAPGYTRLTPGGGAYTSCVPCNCHGHGVSDRPCDPDTGVCVCDHHTTGKMCELCEDGYYGDPTRGAPDACKPCMCPGNVIAGDVNVFASTCTLGPGGHPVCVNCTTGHDGDQCDTCRNHWYGVPTDPTISGGQCLACECNGRAETCNTTTGMCLDCTNNTAGQQCDICAPTFYGNALTNDCKPCECKGLGSDGDCDPRTGQCVCKPNVVGFKCTGCGPQSFNFSSGQGCQNCSCHPVGSLDQQCDVITGQCVCAVHVTGRQCDACEDTFWNINKLNGCDPCECTQAGTANVTGATFGTCDVTSGQCTCARDAIIGRTCDYCAKGTKGTYPDCELCGECFDNWAAKVDQVGHEMLHQYHRALHIWDHYGNMTVDEVVPIIGNLSLNISLVDNSMNETLHTVHELRELQAGYDKVGSNVSTHHQEVSGLQLTLVDAQTMLDELRAFTGAVQLPDATYTNIATTSTLVQLYTDSQRVTYESANASWLHIQNLTEAVRVSNGSVTVFIDRVSAAMLDLDDALRMGDAANMILGGQFHTEDFNNSVALSECRDSISGLPAVIALSAAHRDAAQLKLMEANMTTDMAVTAVEKRLTEMRAASEHAQILVFNATMAKESADQAQIVVDILLSEANTTRANLTMALVSVVSGIRLTENITAEIRLLDIAAAEISATSLRSVDEMEAITAQIEKTSLSQNEVQQLLLRADVTLNMAASAINVTDTASDEAHRTLELVKDIRYNLEEAGILRNTTQDIVRLINEYNTSITATLNTVQSKSDMAASVADEVHKNISVSAVEINNIYKCFQDKQLRSNNSRILAREAELRAQDTAKNQESNIAQLHEVEARSEGLEGRYTQFLHDLLEVKAEVDDLLDDLGIVSGRNDVDFLLETFQTHHSEVEQIGLEIQKINANTNTAMESLDRLDPDTATCNHS